MLHVCEKTRYPIYKNLKQFVIICAICGENEARIWIQQTDLVNATEGRVSPFRGLRGECGEEDAGKKISTFR